MQSPKLSRGASTVHQMYVHLVFVIKKRQKLVSPAMETAMRGIFDKVCIDLECKMLSMKSDEDHVHVLVNFPPKVAIAELVNRMKGVSSYAINRLSAEDGGRAMPNGGEPLWTASYFVKTVASTTFEVTERYIAGQGAKKSSAHDKRR